MMERIVAATVMSMLVALTSPTNRQETGLPSRLPTTKAADQLLEILNAAPDILIPFENVNGAPVTITDAAVKAIQLNQSWAPLRLPGEYAMRERITVVNNADMRITGARLKFTNIQEGEKFEVPDRIPIEPYSSAVFGERRGQQPASLLSFLYSHMPPQNLSVVVTEVRFADGIVWEAYPSVAQSDVDTRPSLRNYAQATYTQEAKSNRIQGAVRMALLVGTYGRVKQARILRGLPDGLNEEAIQAAYNLRFKPAVKQGKATNYWLVFELDFNLTK